MLFAARESAVTKKPRLRLTIRRSSSVSPFGDFHISMSRLMLISCGIQWFAQVARYFSHAHLYLKGTSWLTSEEPLMTRLSSTRTRSPVSAGGASATRCCAVAAREEWEASTSWIAVRASGCAIGPAPGLGLFRLAVGSSQLSISNLALILDVNYL